MFSKNYEEMESSWMHELLMRKTVFIIMLFILYIIFIICSILFLKFVFVFVFFRAVPMAYESLQATGWIGAIAAGLQHRHSNMGSEPTSVTCTTAHGISRSLTHWVWPGIEPASSRMLVWFITTEPWWELRINFWIWYFDVWMFI